MRAILIAVCGTAVFASSCLVGWMHATGRIDVAQWIQQHVRMSPSAPPAVASEPSAPLREEAAPAGLASADDEAVPASATDDQWDTPRRPWEPPARARGSEVEVVNETARPVFFEIDVAHRQIRIHSYPQATASTMDARGSQWLTIEEGEYLLLVDGQPKGAPVRISGGREHALEFLPGGEGPGQGTLVRLSSEGRTLFQTFVRSAPERPAQDYRAPSPVDPLFGVVRTFLGVRYVCADCREVHDRAGTCPDCGHSVELARVWYECPRHGDIVSARAGGSCRRCHARLELQFQVMHE